MSSIWTKDGKIVTDCTTGAVVVCDTCPDEKKYGPDCNACPGIKMPAAILVTIPLVYVYWSPPRSDYSIPAGEYLLLPTYNQGTLVPCQYSLYWSTPVGTVDVERQLQAQVTAVGSEWVWVCEAMLAHNIPTVVTGTVTWTSDNQSSELSTLSLSWLGNSTYGRVDPAESPMSMTGIYS